MIDIKPPEEKPVNLFYQQLEKDSQISEKLNTDMYLDKFQDVADRLRTLIEMRFDSEAVTVSMDFLKEIDWLLSVGHRAYMNKPNEDLHEIIKTLKEILREMKKGGD